MHLQTYSAYYSYFNINIARGKGVGLLFLATRGVSLFFPQDYRLLETLVTTIRCIHVNNSFPLTSTNLSIRPSMSYLRALQRFIIS